MKLIPAENRVPSPRFPPQFSPHGETLLYVALKGVPFFAVAGGWEGPTKELINNPQFSSDGTIIAYIAEQNQKSFVVVGDGTEAPYDDIGAFATSRGGSKVAYIATEKIAGPPRKQKQFVVSGEWRSPTYVSEWPYDALSGLALSSDGDELMYFVKKGKTPYVIMHGKHEAEYEGVRYALLSPDGNSCAFSTERDGKYSIVVNGRPGRESDDFVAPLEFSADSSR